MSELVQAGRPMSPDDFIAWLATLLLLAARLGVAVGLSPGWSAYGVPATVRVVLVLALAALAAGAGPSVSPALRIEPSARLFEALAAELCIGALLGLGLRVALAAFALAGRLLDVQVGFAMGSLFDPVAQAGTNAFGALLGMLGVVLFFASDAHLAMAHMVALSTGAFPLGAWPDWGDPLRPLAGVGALFTLGLALAAPVSLALLLTDLALGLAARNLSQLNLLVLGMPVRVAVGTLVLALSLPPAAPLVERILALGADVPGARR